MRKFVFSYIAILFSLGVIFSACQSDPLPPALDEAVSETDTTLNLNRAFQYKKIHQWGDSLQVMVLSWGTDSLGGYLILLADSARQNYMAASHFRNGPVMRSWIDDLDRDSLPEVAVVVNTMNNRQTGYFTLHEFEKDFTLEPIEMEPLSEQLGAEYDGRDSIYSNQSQIVREFALARPDSTKANDSLKNRRRILYNLENNSLIVTDYEDM
jgi:hypothetical protein